MHRVSDARYQPITLRPTRDSLTPAQAKSSNPVHSSGIQYLDTTGSCDFPCLIKNTNRD